MANLAMSLRIELWGAIELGFERTDNTPVGRLALAERNLIFSFP